MPVPPQPNIEIIKVPVSDTGFIRVSVNTFNAPVLVIPE